MMQVAENPVMVTDVNARGGNIVFNNKDIATFLLYCYLGDRSKTTFSKLILVGKIVGCIGNCGHVK